MSQDKGTLSILNIQKGDEVLRFDTPEEKEAGAKRIEELLKQGATILVETSPDEWTKATGYDPEKNVYKLVGEPPTAPVAETKATAVPPMGGG